MCTGYDKQRLLELDALDVEFVVRLQIEMGKCRANLGNSTDSAASYQCSYKIMQDVPVSDQIQDRTIVFSIVSGICLCLKWGTIQDDENSSYEEQLVARFIHEARLNGDAAHTSRALALQGVFLGRLGRYADAVQSHTELESVYDCDFSNHPAEISKNYGSDRAAQNWGLCAQWCDILNDEEGVFKRVDFLMDHILPSQEERNTHNMFMILFPVVWVLKNHGKALQAKELFEGYIVKRFIDFYGEGGRTWSLRFFDMVLILLLVLSL